YTGAASSIKRRVLPMADRPLSIDIKHALLLKGAELFLITNQDGSVPLAPPGFGLFYRDCRYLSQYELTLNGTRPLLLMSTSDQGFAADVELTNASLKSSNGAPIHTHMLGIQRQHVLMGEECAFIDILTFRNFTLEEVEFPFALTFTAGFESIFVLRGTPLGKRDTMHTPQCHNSHVRFSYSGADGILRILDVGFSMSPIVAPQTAAKTVANFDLVLAPQQSKALVVSFQVRETSQAHPDAAAFPPPTLQRLRDYRKRTTSQWLRGFARTDSRNGVLNDILHRRLDRQPRPLPYASAERRARLAVDGRVRRPQRRWLYRVLRQDRPGNPGQSRLERFRGRDRPGRRQLPRAADLPRRGTRLRLPRQDGDRRPLLSRR